MNPHWKLRLGAAVAALACPTHATAAGGALVAPTLSDVTQQRATTAGAMRKKAKIAFTNGLKQSWTARSDVAWLVIDTPSGTQPGFMHYHVDGAVAATMVVNWDNAVGTVTVSSPGLADVRSTMSFHRHLPEVTMLTPAQVLPGHATTLTLSGKGFMQVDAIGEITVGGVPATSGTIVSDTQATIDLPAQAAGAQQVRVTNVLNQQTSQAQVAVADAIAAYAAVPTPSGTSKTSMVYDPSRQAVYASDWYGQAVARYKFDGRKWTLKVFPWSGAWRVQLSPDRRTLYVLGSNGLSEADPDTLQVRVVHPEMTGFQGFYYYYPLALTNDLRLWGPQGTQYLDLRHGTVGGAAAEFSGVAADDLVPTPDGAHIYSTEGYYSPPPPNGWYSTAKHAATPMPAGLLSYNYDASFDEQGRKGVFSGMSVYKTADWSLIGLLQAPTGSFNFGNAVMSPDGRRVYALTASGDSADHVSVYDTTRRQAGTSNLLLVGTIPVANPAAVCNGEYECDPSGRFAIDPTGSTLFWAGNGAFTVIPIPADLRPQGAVQ